MENKNWIKENYVAKLLSVIIPSYNREGYLEEAIQSVTEQAYRPIECIIVDDGSQDGTKEMVEMLAKSVDSGFDLVYIIQENSGSQAARNRGTIASRGEYIQYLDSDDLLYADKLKRQIEFLVKNPDIDGVFGDWEKGTPGKSELIKAYESDDMVVQLLTEKCIANFTFLMRRILINKIGKWDETLRRNQEIDFQVRGLLKGAKYTYQEGLCGLWRVHEGERVANTTAAIDVLHFFQLWERRLINRGLFNDRIRNNISNILYWVARKAIENNEVSAFEVLKESNRLNNENPFSNSKKIKLISKILGKKIALLIWLKRYERHLKKLCNK